MIDFQNLLVWKKAHALSLQVYRESSTAFRRDKSLATQVRRSAVSVSANIVEGCGRASQAELARFIKIALGSAIELEYHLLLSRDLGYLSADRYAPLRRNTREVKRMLTGLLKAIHARNDSKSSLAQSEF
jgi:four helix bundle protein